MNYKLFLTVLVEAWKAVTGDPDKVAIGQMEDVSGTWITQYGQQVLFARCVHPLCHL